MGFESFTYSKELNTMVKKYLIPKRIIKSENTDFPEYLLTDAPRQPSQSLRNNTIIHKGGYVLLDYGSELNGGVDITTQRMITPGGRLRIVFGESVMEALSSIGEKNATNHHSVRDMTVEAASMSSARFGTTGFRFVKVEAMDCDVHIRGIKAVFEYKDIEYKGSFECNDKLLNKIWNTAAYTVHLNMQDYLIEGTKRDRLVWLGDLHPEISTVMAVFGNDSSVEKSLDLVRDDTPLDNIDGSKEENLWMNTFPSYTFWWIKIQRDWYMNTGNIDYLNEQKEYIYKATRLILSRIADDGQLNFHSYFVDWSSADTEYQKSGFCGCLVIALHAAAEIFEIYGDKEMSEACLSFIPKVAKSLGNYHENKQMAAMVSLAGIADSREISDNILKKNLLHGLSTFYGFYVLNALAKTEDIQSAIDIIRGYWGEMLKFGATSFWEDFDIDWIANAAPIDEIVPEGKDDIHGDFGKFCYQNFRHSLSHGWASGPAPFMSHYILGVEAAAPGFKKVRIKPNLGDLSWVKGTYPTPLGIIKIEHHIENGKIISDIKLPDGMEIVE